MHLTIVAVFVLLLFVALALLAGVGLVGALAAVAVTAVVCVALTAIAVVLWARHVDAVRGRSSRAQVLHDIRAVESRLAARSR